MWTTIGLWAMSEHRVVVLPYRDRTDLYELMAHRPITLVSLPPPLNGMSWWLSPLGKVTGLAEACWKWVWSRGVTYGAKIWISGLFQLTQGDYAQVIVVVLSVNHNRSVGHELIEIGPIPIGEDHKFQLMHLTSVLISWPLNCHTSIQQWLHNFTLERYLKC